MLFWHLGGTIFVFRYVFKDPGVDLRFLALGAILPSLVDKPLALLVLPDTFDAHRIYGHTLLFALAGLTVAVLATRRGTEARRRAVAFAVGLLIHLLLDGMWIVPETLFWPAFGLDFPPASAQTMGEWLTESFTDPWTLVFEVVGLVYLASLWRRAQLRDPERRRMLRTTGRIGVD